MGAVLERADAADAFISNRYERIDQLPYGARVARLRCGARRSCARCARILNLTDLRGNVGTRLAKLDDGNYDANHSGLVRASNVLGLAPRIRRAP